MLSLLLALLAAAPARARNMEDIRVAREDWRTIGWNDACSVAFVHRVYPRLGDAVENDPVSTRAGTLTIAPGEENAVPAWVLEADGAFSWSPAALAGAEKTLLQGGYGHAGYPETIRPDLDGTQPGPAATLLSTSTLAARAATGWPGKGWRWAAAEFNPLSTCALLVFENTARKSFYRFHLVRVYDPRARVERARAHAENARLLFDQGDLEAASAEAETGARLGPESAVARYRYAAMLALNGRENEAMAELAAAVALDPKYKERARKDLDFEELAKRRDFHALTK